MGFPHLSNHVTSCCEVCVTIPTMVHKAIGEVVDCGGCLYRCWAQFDSENFVFMGNPCDCAIKHVSWLNRLICNDEPMINSV